MSSKFRRALFALVTLVGVLALAEVGARTYGGVVRAMSREGSSTGAGGLAVVCVGDSWVNGYGVRPGESWPAVLASAVAAAGGPPITVENLGASGTNPLEAAQALARRVESAGPIDLVFALVGMNPGLEYPGEARAGGVLRAARPYLSHSAVYRLLTQVVWRAELGADAVLAGSVQGTYRHVKGGLVESREEAARHEQLESERLATDVARMDALATIAGGSLVLLNYALPPILLADPNFVAPVVNRRIEVAATQNAVPLIDMQAEYLRRGVQGPEVVIGGAAGLRPSLPGGRAGASGDARSGGYELHPNVQGHAIYADAVARYVVAR
ncbi:MAG: SGNH/GDSL hydrolase family protein [Deltaproteobacteria bacterium]|nr:SGNH/GDSL hydrolase family protein [Deltaproteobacteria bacterium]